MPTMYTLEDIRRWRWRHQKRNPKHLKKQEPQREHGKHSLPLKKAKLNSQNSKGREIQKDKYKTFLTCQYTRGRFKRQKPGETSVAIYDTRDKLPDTVRVLQIGEQVKKTKRGKQKIHGCPMWKRLVSREMPTQEHQDNNKTPHHSLPRFGE